MIQIDMEMPKNCKECSLPHIIANGNYCYSTCSTGRPEWCPLHEVAEDPDTISRQSALDTVNGLRKWSLRDGFGKHIRLGVRCYEVLAKIKELPPSPSRQQIHCKDCKYGSPDGKHGCKSYHHKLYETHEMGSDDFCSRAELKRGAV